VEKKFQDRFPLLECKQIKTKWNFKFLLEIQCSAWNSTSYTLLFSDSVYHYSVKQFST